jgi:hypothetical protein
MALHPLQTALDRATQASFTLVDLLDIARARKPVTNGREGRTDARQSSLYRAVVAASMAALEETFESLTVSSLSAVGVPGPALSRITTAIGKGMQSPNPQNLDALMNDYLGFEPSGHWSAYLSYSVPAYKRLEFKDQSINRRLIHTTATEFEAFTGPQLNDVLSRFVKIRNSFAHQDTSTTIFTKSQRAMLASLKQRKAQGVQEIAFVEGVNSTCSVTLNVLAGPLEDPVYRWTLHELHAINSLLAYVGIISSTTSALAEHLESTANIRISDYDKLVLRVQDGGWWYWSKQHDFSSTHVQFVRIPYAPNSRIS